MVNDTVVAGNTAAVDFNITINGPLELGVAIEDRSGRVMQTLREPALLETGVHSFSWDGTNATGVLVPHGVYFAIVNYQYRGPIERLDESLSTAGQPFKPDLLSATTGEFRPFADEPVVVSFNLQQSAELTFFMGNANVDQRTNTLTQRKLHGSGDYTFEWYGVETSGRLVPEDGTEYTVGMFAYSLGKNAIFVRNAPEITTASISHRYFTPGDYGAASLTLAISKPARIESRIKALTTGTTIETVELSQQTAGLVMVSWDGMTSSGEFPSPGFYSIGAVAIDENGARSPEIIRVFEVTY